MSDPCTKRRPMIDLEEFERSLRRLCPTNQKDGEPLAELLRIIGGQDESHRTVFEPKSQGLAEARQDTGEPDEWKQPDAQDGVISGDFAAIEAGLLGARQPQAAILPETETSNAERKKPNAQMPLISGDFAAIEAGLLGANREKAAAIVSEVEVPNAFLSVDLGSERWLYQDGTAVSHHDGVADEEIRSRRPLYAMGAIIIVGMAGIAASFGIMSGVSGPLEIAPITAENGPATLQVETTSGANVSAQDSAILSKAPEPSPVGLVNNTEQPVDLSQAEETTPRVVALGRPQAAVESGLATEAVSVPVAPAQTQTLAEPLSMAAPTEPKKMKTELNRPDGALLPNDTPPQANVMGAPLPARRPAAKAKAPTPKTAARLAKTPKPAARAELGGSGQPAQIANAGEAKSAASAVNAKPTPIADAQAEAPANPSPATNGAFGMQTAVNSLASATAKLLEWGRIETHLGR